MTQLCKKACQRLYVIKRLKKLLNKTELILIYNATILSILEYNGPLLVGLNKKCTDKIEKVRRRAHRVICGIDCRCQSFTPIQLRRNVAALKVFRKMMEPENLLYFLIPPNLQRSRHSDMLLLPRSRTHTRRTSFIPFCTVLHNRLSTL